MVRQTSQHGQAPTPVDYDLTCWYLNARRVVELVGVDSVAPGLSQIESFGGQGDPLRRIAELSALKDALVVWLRAANPPTLGQLLVTGKLQLGTVFTHYTNFFCKGLSQVRAALDKGRSNIPMAEAYAKLDSYRPGSVHNLSHISSGDGSAG